jgi:AcrR family transcriptional regulator
MDLRADAARNRAAVVAAAREVFAEQGLDAPLDEIARRAGIGNATLYRRFPTRADLVAAVFADRMAEDLDAVAAALADPDPWRGFATYVRHLTELQARDRGIADLVTMDVSRAPEIERLRVRAYDQLVELAERARTAGALRPDVTAEDVALALMANAGLVERTEGIAAAASRRLVHLLLDGLRAEGATEGPPPPSMRRVRVAMRRLAERRLGRGRGRRPARTTRERREP